MGKEITDKLNTVVLGFEAFRVEGGIYYPLCSMAFTNPINNLKNPSTGDLKICRISAFSGSVTGGDEIFIFIELKFIFDGKILPTSSLSSSIT